MRPVGLRTTATANPSPDEPSAARLIDAIVERTGGWRGDTLSQLRAAILRADPLLVEEVKWRKPSNPMGVPVWSHDGIVCVGDVLKRAVRLTFPKGAEMEDPAQLFNARLESRTVRAIDAFEGARVDAAALASLVTQGVRLNTSRRRER